ncbi:MAG: MFS transporter [Patescibacteria group bacterium]|nr:MFS transporter [Patescibacteria group bacterium]
MVTNQAKLLAATDIILAGAFGLILPILPIFLIDRISGATLLTIALSYSIFLTAKAFFGWVFGLFLTHGDYISRIKSGLFFGSLLITATPIAYLYATNIGHIFLAQILLGLGFAFMKTSWMHLTHQTIEEFFHETLLHIHGFILTFCLAIAAALGGFISYNYGYETLLYTMTSLGLLATILSIIFSFSKDKKPAKRKTTKRKSRAS